MLCVSPGRFPGDAMIVQGGPQLHECLSVMAHQEAFRKLIYFGSTGTRLNPRLPGVLC